MNSKTFIPARQVQSVRTHQRDKHLPRRCVAKTCSHISTAAMANKLGPQISTLWNSWIIRHENPKTTQFKMNKTRNWEALIWNEQTRKCSKALGKITRFICDVDITRRGMELDKNITCHWGEVNPKPIELQWRLFHHQFPRVFIYTRWSSGSVAAAWVTLAKHYQGEI